MEYEALDEKNGNIAKPTGSGLSEITQSLIGVIPASDMTLEHMKEERLKKLEDNV